MPHMGLHGMAVWQYAPLIAHACCRRVETMLRNLVSVSQLDRETTEYAFREAGV